MVTHGLEKRSHILRRRVLHDPVTQIEDMPAHRNRPADITDPCQKLLATCHDHFGCQIALNRNTGRQRRKHIRNSDILFDTHGIC